MADPSSSSAVYQQGMAEFPAPMSPPASVASSCMSTILDTPPPPPRQNHGLQPQAPPHGLQPQPPPAGVTRQDLEMHDRIEATKTPLTRASLDIPASLDQPAILNYPAIQKKKTLAGQGISAIRKPAEILALPGTPINPPMDAENKDTTPRALRGEAKADTVWVSMQQAAPEGTTKKRLKNKTKVEEEEERQRFFKKRPAADAACGGIAKKPAIVPTEEKAVPVAAEPAANAL